MRTSYKFKYFLVKITEFVLDTQIMYMYFHCINHQFNWQFMYMGDFVHLLIRQTFAHSHSCRFQVTNEN